MVAQCLEGNVALASLAIDHGMNPTVLHGWVMEHERYGKHTSQDNGVSLPVQTADMTPANWLAFKPPPVDDDRQGLASTRPVAPMRPDANPTIEVVLAARGLAMTLHWPVSEHKTLARWNPSDDLLQLIHAFLLSFNSL